MKPTRPKVIQMNVAGSWGVNVLSERCETCVFRPGNPMHLEEGRLKNLVDANLRAEAPLVCHSTLPYAEAAQSGQWPEDQQAVCRGFFDSYGMEVQALRIAARLGMIRELPPPEKGSHTAPEKGSHTAPEKGSHMTRMISVGVENVIRVKTDNGERFEFRNPLGSLDVCIYQVDGPLPEDSVCELDTSMHEGRGIHDKEPG